MLYFEDLTEEQINDIECLVCMQAQTRIQPQFKVAKCATIGCSNKITYPSRAPETVPKVCQPCGRWLSICIGPM